MLPTEQTQMAFLKGMQWLHLCALGIDVDLASVMKRYTCDDSAASICYCSSFHSFKIDFLTSYSISFAPASVLTLFRVYESKCCISKGLNGIRR